MSYCLFFYRYFKISDDKLSDVIFNIYLFNRQLCTCEILNMLHPFVLCCCVLVVQAMEQYNNPHLLMELNSTKTDKFWFTSIRIPLTSVINVSPMHTVDSWYDMLCRRAELLTNWCLPKDNNTISPGHANHTTLWTPCGYVKIILGMKQHNFTSHIYTYRLLVVQIYFRLFEMDTSNAKCLNSSSLSMCQYRNDTGWNCPPTWHYCGRHPPWRETTSSNRIITTLKQLNVRSSCNISFTYTSLDINIAEIFNKYEESSFISVNKLPFGFVFDQSNIKSYIHLTIITPIGYTFQLDSISTCCFSGNINIFEGHQNYHLLLFKKITTHMVEEQLNITANYFLLSVQLYAATIHFGNSRDRYLMLRYTFRSMYMQSLRIGEVTTVNNAGGLLYKRYHIRHNGVNFPNVSFTIRKFEGWSGDYCHFGGYTLIHSVMTGTTHQAQYEQGAFCSKSLPSHPFVGDIGPKYIVLGSFHYDLIVYAYGPLYDIDIDIHIHPSDCEGMFEPHNMCYTEMDKTDHKDNIPQRYILGMHYEMLCVATNHDGKLMYIVNIYNIKKCLVVQSVSLRKGYNEYYTFVGTMDIGLTVRKITPSSSDGEKTTVDHGYTSLVTLDLRTYVVNIDRLNISWKASYVEISTMKMLLSDVRPSHGMYIHVHIDVVNVTTDCINSVNQRKVYVTTNKNTVGLHEISNMCGLIGYSKPFIYAFNFNLHAGLWHYKSILIYMHLNTRCSSNKTVNIFTVVAQRGTLFHSVSMTEELYVLSQEYEPISFVYENNIGCTFQIMYKARMYSKTAYMGFDYGSLKSYIKVRWLGLLIYIPNLLIIE